MTRIVRMMLSGVYSTMPICWFLKYDAAKLIIIARNSQIGYQFMTQFTVSLFSLFLIFSIIFLEFSEVVFHMIYSWVLFAGIRGEIQVSISLKLPLSNDCGYVRILSGRIYAKYIIFRFNFKTMLILRKHFMDDYYRSIFVLLLIHCSAELFKIRFGIPLLKIFLLNLLTFYK